jgi:hypothetical protein
VADLDEIIAEAHARDLPAPQHRDLTLPWLPHKVDAVIGMRRAGKTWLLFQRMQQLMQQGIPREHLLYLNFEDDRLGAVDLTVLSELVEAHYRRVPSARGAPGALFFDEIQIVDGWERFVRRIVDTETAHVCVSGSSAKMLSREIATSLRGRSVATEVFPYSFTEIAAHAGIARGQLPGARDRSKVERLAVDYVSAGGFPEVQDTDEETRVRVLQSYLDAVILRDVIERHAVQNAAALRRFVQQLVNNPAGMLSVHKLHGDLSSQGFAVAKDSLHAWLDHLEDAFAFFTVPIHARSERARQRNPRKLYAVDPGLVTACARRENAGVGHLLETAVFLELRRRTDEITYVRTKSGFEVDFLTPDGLVQACASVRDEATYDREVRALQEAMAEHGTNATLVTLSDPIDKVTVPEGTIRVVPFWRWALGVPPVTEARAPRR